MQTTTEIPGGRAFPEAIDGMPQSAGERNENIDSGDFEETDGHATPVQGDVLNKAIMNACEEIAELKLERKSINAQIQAVLEDIEAKGIPKVAFKICLANIEMTEDQRAAFDLGVMITRGAVGFPVQTDMFGGAGK